MRVESPDIPIPDQVTVLEAGPSFVRLRWHHPGGDDIWFAICVRRDGQEWWPMDETEGTPATQPNMFEYSDELPSSGTWYYAVRAFSISGAEWSAMSEPVTVTIVGPAAGDP